MQHPGLGLCSRPETIGDKSLLGRFEELFDLFFCEFLPEFRPFLRAEAPFLPTPACLNYQLDMPVIQWVKYLAQDFEELIITSLFCHFRPVDVILLFPVDVPQFEKWIPVVKSLPQLFEILFRVTNDHGSVDVSCAGGADSTGGADGIEYGISSL